MALSQSPSLSLVSSPNPAPTGTSVRSRRYREKDPERSREKGRRCYAKAKSERPIDHWVQYVLREAKYRAKKKGIPFCITKDDLVVPDFCPYLGIRLQVGDGKVGPSSPSLDRLRPELGYVPGNVQVISHRANTLKSSGTAEEHEHIAFIMRQQGLK